jgi:hypothetical protein
MLFSSTPPPHVAPSRPPAPHAHGRSNGIAPVIIVSGTALPTPAPHAAKKPKPPAMVPPGQDDFGTLSTH